jgi:hypothetical protein
LGTVENAGKLLCVENKISGHLSIKITYITGTLE